LVAGLAEWFWFMAEPVAVDTVPGYVTFRFLGMVLPVLPLVRPDLGGSPWWAWRRPAPPRRPLAASKPQKVPGQHHEMRQSPSIAHLRRSGTRCSSR
jgi:hypothetical protein